MLVYMISITGNSISQYYKHICKKSWHQLGYDVLDYEAITPLNLNSCAGLSFKRRSKNRTFTETEKSIWYSHYNLWKKCVEIDEPMVVIEHDCYLYDRLPDVIDQDVYYFVKMISKRIVQNGIYGRVSPAAGYYITPSFAKILLQKTNGDITINVDGFMMNLSIEIGVIPYKFASKEFDEYHDNIAIAIQKVDTNVGTTIVH